MRDPDLLAQGNDAPAGSAEAPSGPPSGDSAPRKRNIVARIALAGAAGTTSPLHRSNYAQPTSRGYGEAMGRGFELALTLVVMVGIGWGVDRLAGTQPLFIIIFSVLGFAGITAKLFIGYDLEMREHTEGAIWNRGKGTNPDASGNGHQASGPETMAS